MKNFIFKFSAFSSIQFNNFPPGKCVLIRKGMQACFQSSALQNKKNLNVIKTSCVLSKYVMLCPFNGSKWLLKKTRRLSRPSWSTNFCIVTSKYMVCKNFSILSGHEQIQSEQRRSSIAHLFDQNSFRTHRKLIGDCYKKFLFFKFYILAVYWFREAPIIVKNSKKLRND